jgi:[ribosomal protein S5]-alanine N-acetyltransferase
MLQGKRIMLRTIRHDELDAVYRHIADINAKGPWWHLDLPSEQSFHHDFMENGCWGEHEGRMLIMAHPGVSGSKTTEKGDHIGELLYFKGLDYQSGLEVGYEIFDAVHYGKGYMTEALSLFCAYLFSVRPINRIQVNLMKGNQGSRRVAEKCGFTYEGTMRAATFNRGAYHDLELFSLLRDECPDLEGLLGRER